MITLQTRKARQGYGSLPKIVAWGLCALSLASWCPGAGPKDGACRGPSPLVFPADKIAPVVVACDNGDATQWAELFVFDSPSHPKLVQLREEYKLDELVKGAKTDLDRALALKNWVAHALKFGMPSPEVYKDWSAIALLERVKRGQRVFCGQCAMVFQQACMSIGLPARFIELGVDSNPGCHFTTEVFLREHNKWAVLDATALEGYNCYYTVDGVPQSALEMHQRVVGGGMEKVMQVTPEGAKPVSLPGKDGARPQDAPWSFYYVRWLFRCDIVTHTPEFTDPEHTFNRWRDTLEWVDDKTVPWEASDKSFWWTRNCRLSALNTSDPAAVNWPATSQPRINIRTRGWKDISVDLYTGDINFDHFQVSLNGADWQPLPSGNTYMGWRSPSGHQGPSWGPRLYTFNRRNQEINELRVQVVRQDGSLGPISFVKLSNGAVPAADKPAK